MTKCSRADQTLHGNLFIGYLDIDNLRNTIIGLKIVVENALLNSFVISSFLNV